MSTDTFWYIYSESFGREEGPFNGDEIESKIADGELHRATLVYHDGMANWEPAGRRSELRDLFPEDRPEAVAPPPPPGQRGVAHEIEYEIFGDDMQLVEVTLDSGEACVAEAGSFLYMDPGIEMQTIFGDGTGQKGGFMGKLMSAGKRVLTGESLFMTVFDNRAGGPHKVAFAAPYPGKIVAFDLLQHNGTILAQKDAFLCAAKGVSIGIAFQRRLGAGFFGGEGFILQRIEGDGLAFLHAGGTLISRRLAPGEVLRVDTGCMVAFESTVDYDIQTVPGIKTALFGGEGLFFARLTGPGTVWLQSLPFSRLASRVIASAPRRGGSRKGEGTLFDGLDFVIGSR